MPEFYTFILTIILWWTNVTIATLCLLGIVGIITLLRQGSDQQPPLQYDAWKNFDPWTDR